MTAVATNVKTLNKANARANASASTNTRTSAKKRDELQRIPGVGPSLAEDLHELGVHTIRSLATKDPELLFARLERKRAFRQDPCVLYVFRCAVYFARTPDPDLGLLRWWRWKDRRLDDLASGATQPTAPTVPLVASGATQPTAPTPRTGAARATPRVSH